MTKAFHRHFYASIRCIPHKLQRYDTVGDWSWRQSEKTEQTLVTVSHLSDWRREYAVAIHELVEAALCHHAGVTEDQVTAWDLAHPDADEPGEVAGAPYFDQHAFATVVEKMLIEKFGINWNDYAKEIQEL